MESESAHRERRQESARGCMHLISGRAHVHTQQSRFFGFFFCAFPTCAGQRRWPSYLALLSRSSSAAI